MDVEIQKLLLLLVFQLSLLGALETLSGIEGVIFVWYWQQVWCMTLTMHNLKRMHGRQPRRLWAHERGLRQLRFFRSEHARSFNTREFKDRIRMDVSIFQFYAHRLQSSCKGMIRTCDIQFRFKLRWLSRFLGWPHIIPCKILPICIGLVFSLVNWQYFNSRLSWTHFCSKNSIDGLQPPS